MNKLITNILDNYYAYKFIESIKKDILERNKDLSFKSVVNHGTIDIYLKSKYRDDYAYVYVCSFKKRDSLECLVRDRDIFLKCIRIISKLIMGGC